MNQDKQFQLAIDQCKTINLNKLKIDTFLLVIHFLLKDYKKIDPDETPDPMTISDRNRSHNGRDSAG